MNNKDIERIHEKSNRSLAKLMKYTHPELSYKIKGVGFLTSDQKYDTVLGSSDIPSSFLEKLDKLWHDGIIISSLGFHECEFCPATPFHDTGDKVLYDHKNKITYIFPHMIFHYITHHQFKPSIEFVNFVMEYHPN